MKKNIKLKVLFTTASIIPVGGYINVKCTASEIILYPNCRSMVTAASAENSVFDAATSNSRSVNCMVEVAGEWLIKVERYNLYTIKSLI